MVGMLNAIAGRYHYDEGGSTGDDDQQRGPLSTYDPSVLGNMQNAVLGGTPESALQKYKDAQSAQEAAAQAKKDRIQQAMDTLSANRSNLPMMAFGAGMMKPTHTGTFGETLSNAMSDTIPAIDKQRQYEAQLQQMGVSAADVDLAQKTKAAQDWTDRMKLGLTTAETNQRLQQSDQQHQDSLNLQRQQLQGQKGYYDYLKQEDPDEVSSWVPLYEKPGVQKMDPVSGLPLYQGMSKTEKPVGQPRIVRSDDLDSSNTSSRADPIISQYNSAQKALDAAISKRYVILGSNPKADTKMLDEQIARQRELVEQLRVAATTRLGGSTTTQPVSPDPLAAGLGGNGSVPSKKPNIDPGIYSPSQEAARSGAFPAPQPGID